MSVVFPSLQTEINELEAKLLSLREKESSIISKVDIIDLKIQEMTVDFQPQEESLEKELRDIAEKENEVASKLVSLFIQFSLRIKIKV